MEIDALQLCLIAAILFTSSLVQTVVGFGYGILSNPLLLLLGLSLPETIALICMSSFVQSLLALRKLREHFSYKAISPWALVAMFGVALGMYCLTLIEGLSKDNVTFVVGAIILFLVSLQLLCRFEPREVVPKVWGVLAFFASGFTGGLVGIGGPSVALWVMAHNWSAARSRAFVLAFFVLCLPAYMLALIYLFGDVIWLQMFTALLLFPVIYCGTYLGLKVGDRVDRALLMRLVYLMLLIIAVGSMWPKLSALFL